MFTLVFYSHLQYVIYFELNPLIKSYLKSNRLSDARNFAENFRCKEHLVNTVCCSAARQSLNNAPPPPTLPATPLGVPRGEEGDNRHLLTWDFLGGVLH